jgi:hypothetical protein
MFGWRMFDDSFHFDLKIKEIFRDPGGDADVKPARWVYADDNAYAGSWGNGDLSSSARTHG